MCLITPIPHSFMPRSLALLCNRPSNEEQLSTSPHKPVISHIFSAFPAVSVQIPINWPTFLLHFFPNAHIACGRNCIIGCYLDFERIGGRREEECTERRKGGGWTLNCQTLQPRAMQPRSLTAHDHFRASFRFVLLTPLPPSSIPVALFPFLV